MAKFLWFRCPDCGGTFKHLRVLSDEPPPDRCSLCGNWMNLDSPPEEVFVPQAPRIAISNYAKSWDQTANAIMSSSEGRANAAEDQLRTEWARQDKEDPFQGNTEMLAETRRQQIDELKSGLKITNMREPNETREGDVSAITSGAEAAASRLRQGGAMPGYQDLSGSAPNVVPGTVSALQGRLTSNHATHAASVVRAGQMAPAYNSK